jgi:hypothetical protein
MAEEHKDFVIGFICQSKLTQDPTFLHMTPGKMITNSETNNSYRGMNKFIKTLAKLANSSVFLLTKSDNNWPKI